MPWVSVHADGEIVSAARSVLGKYGRCCRHNWRSKREGIPFIRWAVRCIKAIEERLLAQIRRHWALITPICGNVTTTARYGRGGAGLPERCAAVGGVVRVAAGFAAFLLRPDGEYVARSGLSVAAPFAVAVLAAVKSRIYLYLIFDAVCLADLLFYLKDR